MGFFSVYFELSSTEGDNHLRNFNDLTDNYDEILKGFQFLTCFGWLSLIGYLPACLRIEKSQVRIHLMTGRTSWRKTLFHLIGTSLNKAVFVLAILMSANIYKGKIKSWEGLLVILFLEQRWGGVCCLCPGRSRQFFLFLSFLLSLLKQRCQQEPCKIPRKKIF